MNERIVETADSIQLRDNAALSVPKSGPLTLEEVELYLWRLESAVLENQRNLPREHRPGGRYLSTAQISSLRASVLQQEVARTLVNLIMCMELTRLRKAQFDRDTLAATVEPDQKDG